MYLSRVCRQNLKVTRGFVAGISSFHSEACIIPWDKKKESLNTVKRLTRILTDMEKVKDKCVLF